MGVLAVPIPEYRNSRRLRAITQFGHGEQGDMTLDTSSDNAIKFAMDDDIAPQGSSSVNWYVLLFAVIITLFVVYWGFVCPTSRQLTKLRRYVTSLEKSIADLNGQRASAEATSSLLEHLVRQGNATADAIAALGEIQAWRRSLYHRPVFFA